MLELNKIYYKTIDFKKGILLRNAGPNDWLYIDKLRKKEGNALGFIPKGAYLSIIDLENPCRDKRDRFKYSQILITEDNRDNTGFCYISYFGNVAKIFQIAIQEDARRFERASLIIENINKEAVKRHCYYTTCRVAIDLESNLFWRALGFSIIDIVKSTYLNQKQSKSNRDLFIYIRNNYKEQGKNFMGIVNYVDIANKRLANTYRQMELIK